VFAANPFKPLSGVGAIVRDMAPLITLVSVFVLLSLASLLGVSELGSWVLRLRIALAAMFLLTASAHWGSMRADLVRMVPPALPAPELLVTLTGVAEIAGAIGLLVPRTAPLSALCLAVLLVALFPANVHAANAGLTLAGKPVLGVFPRGLLQLAFLAATLGVALSGRLSSGQASAILSR
jgi:uncharacterized membrane protein